MSVSACRRSGCSPWVRRSSDVDVPSSHLDLLSALEMMSVLDGAAWSSEGSAAHGLQVERDTRLRGRCDWEVDFDVVWVYVWVVAFVVFEGFLGGFGDLVSVRI